MARLDINPAAKPKTPPAVYYKVGTTIMYDGLKAMLARTEPNKAMLFIVEGGTKGHPFSWQRFPYNATPGSVGVLKSDIDNYFGEGQYTISN